MKDIARPKFFDRDVLAMPTSHILIVAADEYNAERGGVASITSTTNGNQWQSTNAFTKDDLIALRDGIDSVLKEIG